MGKSAYHHGDLRRALLQGALDLVRDLGPSGWTLREAARRAGVSHAAPYHHFASKEALLWHLAEEGFRELAADLQGAGVDEAPLARLEALGAAYVRFALRHPSHFQVMFRRENGHPDIPPSLEAAKQAAFGALVTRVAEAQATGDLAGADPLGPALAAWSTVHGLASLWVLGVLEDPIFPRWDVEQTAATCAKAIVRGLQG